MERRVGVPSRGGSVVCVLSLFAWLAACGGGPRAGDPDAGDVIDMEMFREGTSASTDLTLSLAVADSLFDFDPTLDPSMSAEANAALVAAFTEAGLAGCGTVMVTGASVRVDFGAGCTLVTGVSASGAVTVALTKSGGTLTAALTFEMLVVDGRSLEGSATLSTTDGSSFTVSAMLSGTVQANLMVVGTAGAMTIDGTATLTRAGTTTMLTFTSVVWRAGDCYPSSGTLTVGSGRLAQTITFTSASAASGSVTITQGRASREATLPAYGSCPSA